MNSKGDQSSFPPLDFYRVKQRDYKSSQKDQLSLHSSCENKIKRGLRGTMGWMKPGSVKWKKTWA